LVERGPEKAGVGGSIPSLATILFKNLASLKNRVKISRAHNTRTFSFHNFTFGVARSSKSPNVQDRVSGPFPRQRDIAKLRSNLEPAGNRARV
jgi:hypothetical protein